MEVNCIRCGYPNNKINTHCVYCGSNLKTNIIFRWICDSCNNINSLESNFCIYCGNKWIINKGSRDHTDKGLLLIELKGFTNLSTSEGEDLGEITEGPDDIRRNIIMWMYGLLSDFKTCKELDYEYQCAADTWLLIFDNPNAALYVGIKILKSIKENKIVRSLKPKLVGHFGTVSTYNSIPFSSNYILMHYIAEIPSESGEKIKSFEFYITQNIYDKVDEKNKTACCTDQERTIMFERNKIKYFKYMWQ
jgi:hypothetical protein